MFFVPVGHVIISSPFSHSSTLSAVRTHAESSPFGQRPNAPPISNIPSWLQVSSVHLSIKLSMPHYHPPQPVVDVWIAGPTVNGLRLRSAPPGLALAVSAISLENRCGLNWNWADVANRGAVGENELTMGIWPTSNPENRFFCIQGGCSYSCWQERVIRRHCGKVHEIQPAKKRVHWEDQEPESTKQEREARLRCFDPKFPWVYLTLEEIQTFESETDCEESDDDSVEDGGVMHPVGPETSECSSATHNHPSVAPCISLALEVNDSALNNEIVSSATGNTSNDSHEHTLLHHQFQGRQLSLAQCQQGEVGFDDLDYLGSGHQDGGITDQDFEYLLNLMRVPGSSTRSGDQSQDFDFSWNNEQ
ncbi:hypothetical protein CONPUDRAFT_145032 [Coniophora puteana RWD-64-598 SS2]|uniref:Uncharacterized protein n=1 Tax=Coniophora puteana (strain RWD-64-598) TaxID=741705 RepID=A0A5M3MMX8_CONPW|nr:uncharacterized protein CONPUDRAFT_145032 [Coniophora puteana RWD-64-598 SS2]EIW79961.1 hypothetical protein CONPUDRAFT_145032 [Coniophora puteana RWD-64-598 SS2]